jgi:hypothetical protein
MDSLLKEERLPSMKLALSLATVEVETEEDVETDAAEGATNDEFFGPHAITFGNRFVILGDLNT